MEYLNGPDIATHDQNLGKIAVCKPELYEGKTSFFSPPQPTFHGQIEIGNSVRNTMWVCSGCLGCSRENSVRKPENYVGRLCGT